jgi:hypothetical protein
MLLLHLLICGITRWTVEHPAQQGECIFRSIEITEIECSRLSDHNLSAFAVKVRLCDACVLIMLECKNQDLETENENPGVTNQLSSGGNLGI